MNTSSLRWRALAAAATALFAAACAQSNGDINRVQPNVVKKADLLGDQSKPGDGVWYFRNTVTWTPATTGFTYPGQTGAMEKLVWEIQQNTLVGYRAYPYILGADINIDSTSKVTGTTVKYCDKDGVCSGGQQYYGTPVVAFPISSHFDIQRGYDPTTGELTNVISENSTDRPWNQREYIRVDWSANVLNVNSGLNWGTVQNASGGSSSQSWIQPNEKGEDPTDWPTTRAASSPTRTSITSTATATFRSAPSATTASRATSSTTAARARSGSGSRCPRSTWSPAATTSRCSTRTR